MSAPRPLAGDVHTHVWAPEHVSDEFMRDLLRAWPEAIGIRADYAAHAAHASAVERSIVLAFDAEHAGLVVPDEYVAEYVARDPARLIGFCSVDPLRRDVVAKLDRATQVLGLRGVKLAPTYQGFDPAGPEALRLYEEIAARGLPIIWHQGTTFVRRAVLAYALPHQIDDVAIRFPEMPIVIAHLGHPWIDETLAVVRKHPSVYADVSAMIARPRQLRAGLISAAEYRCADKLLFGTDFPFSRVSEARAMLERWRDDPASPPELHEATASILAQDPLAAIGFAAAA